MSLVNYEYLRLAVTEYHLLVWLLGCNGILITSLIEEPSPPVTSLKLQFGFKIGFYFDENGLSKITFWLISNVC